MKRFEFIGFLRGVAALTVLLSHLLCMFWSGGVESVWPFLSTDEPVIGLQAINPKRYLSQMHLDLGNVGVAFFFLISGFLITGSIRRINNPMKFILIKSLRIYPVYIVGFSVTFFIIWLYTYQEGIAFPYTFSDWISQISLVRIFMWLPSIDGISWTLVADMELYLLMVVLMLLKRTTAKSYTVTGVILAMISAICSINMPKFLELQSFQMYHLCSYITLAVYCLAYMLIGAVLSEYEAGWVDIHQVIAAVVVLYLSFVSSCYSYSYEAALQNITGYTFSLIVFLVCYMLSRSGHCLELFSDSKIGGVAKISYSLYILHGLNGYIIETYLYNKGFNNYANFVLTVFVVFVLSIALYYFVEKPYGVLYKKLTKKILQA